MADCQYISMVDRLLSDIAPIKHKLKIKQHLLATDVFQEAHGEFRFEISVCTDHSKSRGMLKDKIKEIANGLG